MQPSMYCTQYNNVAKIGFGDLGPCKMYLLLLYWTIDKGTVISVMSEHPNTTYEAMHENEVDPVPSDCVLLEGTYALHAGLLMSARIQERCILTNEKWYICIEHSHIQHMYSALNLRNFVSGLFDLMGVLQLILLIASLMSSW